MGDAATAPTLIGKGTVERDGERVYYEWFHRGEGDDRPVVVLTHGAGGSHASWFNQVPALAERFRVLTWDSRGFGNSTCVRGVVSAEVAVADLDAVLASAGVRDAVHLVGQSMGGWWIVAFAMAHRHRVRSLTLSDTPGGIWTPALRDHFGTFQRGGGLRSEVVGEHRALGATTMATQPTLAFLYQQLGSFHEPPMAAVGRAIVDTVVPVEAVRALDLPVLVIAGEQDEIFPASGLRELAGLVGARYVELAGAGHSPYFETPGPFNEALLEFLG